MNRMFTTIALAGLAPGAISLSTNTAAVDMCSSLMGNAALKSLPNMTITSASLIAGTFTPKGQQGDDAPQPSRPIQNLPPFCRVTATLKPIPSSNIGVEMWLPTEGWNQKLQG